MPATYEPIQTYTHTGASTTLITLSSIPATYTDLLVVANVLYSANNGDYIGLRFNEDTSALYSSTPMVGNGTSTNSYRASGDTKIAFYASSTSTRTAVTIHINNYKSTTAFKSPLIRSSSVSSDNVEARIGLYRSTSAISSLSIFFPVSSIAAGTEITIYGIKAA
jgi:hypothetical protein